METQNREQDSIRSNDDEDFTGDNDDRNGRLHRHFRATTSIIWLCQPTYD